MHSNNLLALAASVSTALAAIQGFNYGSANSDGSFRYQSDFQNEFAAAKKLVGAGNFNSARLYTMIQGGSSTNEYIQAIPAAIATQTTLLLGLWASGGQGFLSAEISALQSAINKYGSTFTDLVVGISVGSEDLYRISPTGVAAKSGYGADPQTVADYIGQVRQAIKGTSLSGAPIGHVDTWTAWVNGSNSAVVQACDWIGMDAYPYFQNTQSNGIENGKSLFQAALSDTKNAVGGKPVWVTETGWPVSGSTQNLGVPGTENAKTYWDEVGCPLFGATNTWWYTLIDTVPVTPNPSFGIVDSSFKPRFDLTCGTSSSSSSTAVSSASDTQSSTSGGSGPSAIASSGGQSSVAASASSAATGGVLASSGSGLSPSQGPGINVPVISSNGSSSGPSPTGVSGGSGSGNISMIASLTTATTVVGGAGSSATGSGAGSASTTGPQTVSPNAANALTGSFICAMLALGAAAVAL